MVFWNGVLAWASCVLANSIKHCTAVFLCLCWHCSVEPGEYKIWFQRNWSLVQRKEQLSPADKKTTAKYETHWWYLLLVPSNPNQNLLFFTDLIPYCHFHIFSCDDLILVRLFFCCRFQNTILIKERLVTAKTKQLCDCWVSGRSSLERGINLKSIK